MIKCKNCANVKKIAILTLEIKAYKCNIDGYIKDGEIERGCPYDEYCE